MGIILDLPPFLAIVSRPFIVFSWEKCSDMSAKITEIILFL
jgi:hypothetical protein